MIRLSLTILAVLSTSSVFALSALDPAPVYYPAGPEYTDVVRAFQGIPGLEISAGGRLWSTWYGGGTGEGSENYVMLATSGDDGETWSNVKLAIDPPDFVRAFDPCLWHDPGGKLWLFWAQAEDHTSGPLGTWAITTDGSDLANPVWSDPTRLCDGIMMNKPTVTSEGDWLLPAAIWNTDGSCRVVRSQDDGETFELIGQANVPAAYRNCDEPMIVERTDDLWMLVRTDYGIGQSTSTDDGFTWSEVSPTGLPHTASRFFIRRLDSGKLLLVKHSPPSGTSRSYLTAYLSNDDGTSWYGGLLLDERSGVSYPDGVEDEDGTIYITYDYNRTTDRQILMAAFTEADVAAGTAVSDDARFRVLINQAGVYPPVDPPGGILYREIFPNDDSGDQDFAETGWYIHKDDGRDAGQQVLSYVTGFPTTATPVNSQPANSELADGFAISLDAETGVDYLYWTDEFTVDRDETPITEIQWYQRNSDSRDLVRVAVQVGDAWFVSDETFTNPSISSFSLESFDFTQATWSELLFEPGVRLDRTDSANLTLPDGLITAFGLYVDNKYSGRNRFDTFTIFYETRTSIPGDLDGDGTVGSGDLDIVRANWGAVVSEGDLASGDASGDGIVGSADLDVIRANWGASRPGSVPEPGIALFVTMLFLGFGRRMRRQPAIRRQPVPQHPSLNLTSN